MKAEGKGSKSPLSDSFFKYPNNKYVLLALLGATAGQGVVWYTGQFYALFFLIITLKLDYVSAYALIGISLLIGTPFFVVFGWLSDRIGRLKIIMAGCLIAAVTYFPLFQGLTHYVNPALEEFSSKTPITVVASNADCQFHLFVGPWSKFSDCDRVKDFLTKQGLSFKSASGEPGKVVTTIGTTKIEGWDQAKLTATLKEAGAPPSADKTKVNWLMTEVILVIMVIYVTMVYGPIAAFLVELFPTAIRYTSMSLPYHIGNGWFGGMLPLHGNGDGRGDRRHLRRALVSDRRRDHVARHRLDLPVRDEGSRHPDLRSQHAAVTLPRPRAAGRATGPAGNSRALSFSCGRSDARAAPAAKPVLRAPTRERSLQRLLQLLENRRILERGDVSCVISSPFASERNSRRMILPERVFGRLSPKRMSFGLAIGPISLPTQSRSSLGDLLGFLARRDAPA